MNVITTSILTDLQTEQVTALSKACAEKEPLALSSPVEEGFSYYLIYEKDRLVAMSYLYYPEPEQCESSVFVHPDFRKKGYFSTLLNCMLDDVEDLQERTETSVDFCFLVDERTPSAMAVLNLIEAEYWYSEYMMEKELVGKTYSYDGMLTIRKNENSSEEGIQRFEAFLSETPIGHCTLVPSDSSVYFYEFEIISEERSKGYGKQFLKGMIAYLCQNYPDKNIRLQVSGMNYIAKKLYQKLGFHSIQELAYYRY